MRPDKSFRIYPRPDQEFKKKVSLDFQRTMGNLYGQRPTGNRVQAYLWLLCMLIGFIMGTVAFLLDIMASALVDFRWDTTEEIANKNSPGLGWFILILFSILFMLIASILTMYVAPAALGSGVAETMGLFNGVAYPDFICLKVFIVKFLGVAFSVSAGFAGGKEGPLIHMGAIVGYASAYLPIGITQYFRTDFEKRKLMAAGVAAGVSAAFGAPIGGALFAYELSKPNTFWSFSLTWKVFFSSTISAFVLSIFKQLYEGFHPLKVSNNEIIKLGTTQTAPTLDSLVAALILGFVGGLIGASFIRINNRVNVYRKKILTKKYLKVAEAVALVVITATIMYLATYIPYAADSDPGTNTRICQNETNYTHIPTRRFLCPEGTFNRLATIMFESQQNTIRSFMSDIREILPMNALIFFVIWFIFTSLSSGSAVPSGIFLPCILIGCSVGHLYAQLHPLMFGKYDPTDPRYIQPATFAILGAASVLSGSTRMTFSLAVIMLETTSSVELFLPIIFTLFISYGTGAVLINKSIYLSALRVKNIPMLGKSAPRTNRNLTAYNLMSAPAKVFSFIASVQDAYYQLEKTGHNGFPVINSSGRPIGIIERDAIITLIENKGWYNRNDLKESVAHFGSDELVLKDHKSLNPHSDEDDNSIPQTQEVDNKLIQDDMHQEHERSLFDDSDHTDLTKWPLSQPAFKWQSMNQNFNSSARQYKDITKIAQENLDKQLDFRPYMIERPYVVSLFDKFPKILNLFRYMQLRQLLVINDKNGKLEGIITRQDLFQYMTL